MKTVMLQGLFEHGIDFEAGSPEQMEAVLRQIPAGGGVYLLTDEHARLIQLASSGDLRRALRTRLAVPPPNAVVIPAVSTSPEPVDTGRTTPPADGDSAALPAENQSAAAPTAPVPVPARPRADLSQIVRRIWWLTAHSMFEVDLAYWHLARRLMPGTYLRSLAFGPVWFVHVDSAGAIPRFLPGKLLRSPPGMDLGPFATQADANRFVQTLEDVFDLCRYYHILEQVPHGQPCAYFEMGRCPAPCNGTIAMSAYQETVSSALAFARGERKQTYAEWEGQMQQAASDLAFEKAGLLKQRIERARTLDHAAFRLVRPIDDFRYLVVQRAGGRTRIKPFFVRAGRIAPGEPVKLKELDSAVGEWLVRLVPSVDAPSECAPTDDKASDGSDAIDRQQESELIWLVSHYLLKRETPGLFLHVSELGEAAALAERIRSHFSTKALAAESEDSGESGAESQNAEE